MSMDLMQKAIIKLTLDGKIFYSTLLCGMEKTETKSIPTAGVTVDNGQIRMYYNHDFLQAQYDKEKQKDMKLKRVCAILEHELLHLVYEHILRSKLLSRIDQIYNLAADIAINQYVDDLTPGEFLSYDKFNLPPKKDAEFYYDELMKKAKYIKIEGAGGQGEGQNKDKEGKGGGQGVTYKDEKAGKRLDDHSSWKKTSNDNLSKEVVRQAVKDAYQQSEKSRGYIPGGVEEQIKEMLKPPTISWKTLLRQYIGISVKTGFRNSWKRPNRRLGEEFKGKTAKRTINITVAIDTSGSVGTPEFEEFIAEIRGILNIYKSTIKMIECDADIQRVYDLKPFTKVDTKFKGRGGTDYKPVFDYLKKKPTDLLIYFTDLYCDFRGCKAQFDVIWVCTSSGDAKNKPPFGRMIQVNHEKR